MELSTKLAGLQDENEVKYYGNKALILEKIKSELVNVIDESQEFNDDDDERNFVEKRKRIQPIYLPFVKLDNKKMALTLLKEESTWDLNHKPKTIACRNSIHEFYKCKLDTKCPIRVCLLITDDNEPVLIKKSHNVEHIHTKERGTKKEWGLNVDTKTAINQLYIMGTTTAAPLTYSLRQENIISKIEGMSN